MDLSFQFLPTIEHAEMKSDRPLRFPAKIPYL